MRVLVINAGSSSIKYRLMSGPDLKEVAGGLLERIGGQAGRLIEYRIAGDGSRAEHSQDICVADHEKGLAAVLERLASTVVGGAVFDLVAHRVVHGGEYYRDAVLVDDQVLERLRALIPLAPLHNAANVAGIDVARAMRPGVPQVAVFDTAFHQTMPPRAYLYAVPAEWYEQFHVRRYGFHGSSVRYVTERAARLLDKSLDTTSVIVLHLGNGASASAVRDGRSIDTSMGMTPLDGLVMGTRSGDIDPSMLFYLIQVGGLSPGTLDRLLNYESGLKGLAGVSDMRDVLQRSANGDDRASQAIDVYCYRVRKYIGAYMAVLGNVDALVFTGGVGENQPAVRSACLEGLSGFGFVLDAERNRTATGREAAIEQAGSSRPVLVILTNEERQIALEALAVSGVGSQSEKST